MTYCIIAVKDELTDGFMQPTFIKSEEEAIRLFDYQINNIEMWKYNPGDYSLWSLGKFNETSGEIESCVTKIVSGNAVAKGRKETE